MQFDLSVVAFTILIVNRSINITKLLFSFYLIFIYINDRTIVQYFYDIIVIRYISHLVINLSLPFKKSIEIGILSITFIHSIIKILFNQNNLQTFYNIIDLTIYWQFCETTFFPIQCASHQNHNFEDNCHILYSETFVWSN